MFNYLLSPYWRNLTNRENRTSNEYEEAKYQVYTRALGAMLSFWI